MCKNKNTSQYTKKQSVYSLGKVYLVHSNFLSKCTAACIFVIAGVLYILLLLGTPAIRNAGVTQQISHLLNFVIFFLN